MRLLPLFCTGIMLCTALLLSASTSVHAQKQPWPTPPAVLARPADSVRFSAQVLRMLHLPPDSQPLFVIDGVPVAAEEVDALSPTLLGRLQFISEAELSKAIVCRWPGAGVVLITTNAKKRGRRN